MRGLLAGRANKRWKRSGGREGKGRQAVVRAVWMASGSGSCVFGLLLGAEAAARLPGSVLNFPGHVGSAGLLTSLSSSVLWADNAWLLVRDCPGYRAVLDPPLRYFCHGQEPVGSCAGDSAPSSCRHRPGHSTQAPGVIYSKPAKPSGRAAAGCQRQRRVLRPGP